jgi:hypothetical protein
MFFVKFTLGFAVNVVTACVTEPGPNVCGGTPRGVAVVEKLLVTFAPDGNVALGNVTFTEMSQLLPGVRGTVQGLVQVTVAGVVPTQPGWQSAAGVAPLNTVPGGKVSVTGPIAVRFNDPLLLLATEVRNRYVSGWSKFAGEVWSVFVVVT